MSELLGPYPLTKAVKTKTCLSKVKGGSVFTMKACRWSEGIAEFST